MENRMDIEKSGYDKMCDVLEGATLKVTMLICALMLFVTWIHIFMRYIMDSSLTWSEEFLRFSIVWFAMLSASVLHKRRGHIGIVIFREQMAHKTQNVLIRLIPWVSTVATTLAAIYGFLLVAATTGQLTPALRISVAVPYLAIPLSFTFMSIYGIGHILQDRRNPELMYSTPGEM